MRFFLTSKILLLSNKQPSEIFRTLKAPFGAFFVRIFLMVKTIRCIQHLGLILIMMAFFSSAFTQTPLIYLKDKREIQFDGKAKRVQSATISRKYELLIATDEGIDRAKRFSFPENLDPIYYDIAAEVKNIKPHLLPLRVDEFKLRVKRGNTYVETHTKFEEYIREPYVNTRDLTLNLETSRHIDIKNLEQGDVIIVEYQITLEYLINEFQLRSFRLFLHDKYPKVKSELRIKFKKNLDVRVGPQNGGEADKIYGSDQLLYKWERENLAGALGEPNGKPHINLPYVEVFIPNAVHYNPAISRMKNHGFYNGQVSQKIGSTSKQFQLLKQYTQDTLNLTKTQRVIRFHNQVATDFKYDNDSSLFGGERLLNMPKFGNDLIQRRLRESNKLELYNNVLYAYNLDYAALFLSDARIGNMSNTWLQPIYQSDILFMPLVDNDSIVLLYPKDQQHGYFADELPFYFEGGVAEMVFLNPIVDAPSSRSHADRELLFCTIPESKPDSNIRTTNISVFLDSLETEIIYKFDLTLKGQFSTLCRSNYITNEQRRYVNPQYGFRVWDGLNAIKSNCEMTSLNENRPYTAKFQGVFKSEHLQLPIAHIIPEFGEQERTIPYYPDFRFKDVFVIKIYTSRTLNEKQLGKIRSVKATGAGYNFEVEKTKFGYQISSILQVNHRAIQPENFNAFKNIYEIAALSSRLQVFLN